MEGEMWRGCGKRRECCGDVQGEWVGLKVERE